jgi:CubicO group peptidase (beta-lactamase class C family)
MSSIGEVNLQLEGCLDKMMGTRGVRHAVLGVESRDGSFGFVGVRGVADVEGNPMGEDTPFLVASVTKLFVATLVLKLQEAGLLCVDDKVVDYLSRDLLVGVHVVDGVDFCDVVSIRHLLGHSSGIPDYFVVKNKGEKAFVEEIIEGEDRSWSIVDVLGIIRRVKGSGFVPRDLNSKKFGVSYSDTNFQVLIAVIEAVTGKGIEVVFRELLFDPLGLNSSFHPGEGCSVKVADIWAGDVPFVNKWKAIVSFGDVYSTVGDLIEFMRALVDGRVFKSSDTLDLMMKEWHTFGFELIPINPGWPIEYGLGMMRFRMPRFMTPFRPMPAVIGHTGAVGSFLFFCPDLDVFFAGSVGQLTAAAVPFRIVPRLVRIMEDYLGDKN